MHRDKAGYTALLIAASNGLLPVLELLVSRGGGVEERADDGCTCLLVAAASGRLGVVEFLLTKDVDADTDAVDSAGNSALVLAAAGGHKEVIDLLLKRGLDPEVKNKAGKTALTQTKDASIKALIEKRVEVRE